MDHAADLLCEAGLSALVSKYWPSRLLAEGFFTLNHVKVDKEMEMTDIPPKGTAIDWDVPITMEDGTVLRADIFRPAKTGRFPVLLSFGPYGKGLLFQCGYATHWQMMIDEFPEVEEGSSNRYQVWELVDPEKWVPDDYICMRVDSRGAGTSQGALDIFSQREVK